MSAADYLRETAAMMRETAKAAQVWDGYWRVHPKRPGRVIEDKHGNGWDDAIIASCIDYGGAENGVEHARHIAAWHPGVALAVADWLDTAGADIWAHGPLCVCGTGCDACDDNLWEPHARNALAVARAWRAEQ